MPPANPVRPKTKRKHSPAPAAKSPVAALCNAHGRTEHTLSTSNSSSKRRKSLGGEREHKKGESEHKKRKRSPGQVESRKAKSTKTNVHATKHESTKADLQLVVAQLQDIYEACTDAETKPKLLTLQTVLYDTGQTIGWHLRSTRGTDKHAKIGEKKTLHDALKDRITKRKYYRYECVFTINLSYCL